MLKKRTAFVIGAGCSFEFDLPLGAGLRDQIFELTSKATGGSDSDTMALALMRSGVQGVDHNVSSKLRTFARGLHGKQSIDQYLDFHRADPVQVAIGKAAIADTILRAEAKSKLAHSKLKHGLAGVASTWLGRLFTIMNEGVSLANMQDMFHNVRFICFNYDRCIEAFFLHAIQSMSQGDYDQAARTMKALKIWHPYGTVGSVHIPSLGAQPYQLMFGERDVSPDQVLRGMKQLRTFNEGMEDDAPERADILGALHNAEQVVFLGFSFLPQNMELLSLDSPGARKRVYATIKGLPQPEHLYVSKEIEQALFMKDGRGPEDFVQVQDVTAADLIRDWGRRIASA